MNEFFFAGKTLSLLLETSSVQSEDLQVNSVCFKEVFMQSY